ncbi:MAG TPA: sugar phosphate isomerase/epimerase family protein, partial [Bryobacteraceae bacterium]|nr:sugar phosphate isomerase/epimerase family protein [Bryobacteraceae bacterium]
MNPKIPIAAITDEFSPDLDTALQAMREIGMTAAELRVISGKNIMDLSPAELDRVAETCTARGFQVISIASPVFKCLLPNAPPVDTRFQQDVFASKHTFDDQPRLAEHAFAIAEKFGARIVRVFSFWRTVEPAKCFDAIVRELSQLADQAARRNLIVGLENEHACNIATAAETARVLQAVQHPNLKVVWDPANAYVAGENPFP